MSLERLTEALQMAQWLPQQKQFFEKWQNYVLVTSIVGSSSITVTHDEDLGTLTLTANTDARRMALQYHVGDMTTVITTGTAKAKFRLPFAFVVESVKASLHTASTSGAFVADVNINGTSIFGVNKLSLDQDERTSATATTPATYTETTFEDDSEVVIDVDDDGTNATGLVVYLIGYARTDLTARMQENDIARLFEDGTARYLEV